MYINRYLAKSNPEETIQKHTDNLLNQLEILKSIYGDKIDVNFKLLYYACLYHDIGKISIAFQKKVDKSLKNMPIDIVEFPHGVLSTLFIDRNKLKNLGFTDDEIKLLYQSVYYHHNRESIEKLDTSSISDQRELLEKELEGFSYDKLENIKLFNFKERLIKPLNIDQYKKYVILKGLLNRLDYAASAHIIVENKNDFLEKYLQIFMNNLKKEEATKGNLNVDWNDLQKFMKNKTDENIIVVAQTGMGKTEAALLWIGNNKGFFTLPIRTSINSIYERLKKMLIGEKIDQRIAVLHGDTRSYYYKNIEEYDIDSSIEQYIIRTRQLSLPITVCTLDQLFTIVFKYRNYEPVLATLSYSKIVIDEIQMYGPDLLGYLISGLKMIQDVGGKFAIITAIFPEFLGKIMIDNGLKFEIPESPFVDECKIRHNVKWIEDSINSEFIKDKYKNNRVLVICNTVKKCQELFDELESDNINLNMFHSKFIKKDRANKEKEITKFGKLYNKDEEGNLKLNQNNGIWITTSVAEASLDIDFDVLITELSEVNSLFQRFGRCYRKRTCTDEYNCYVFDGGNKDCSGVGTVIDVEIFNISKNYLRNFFKRHHSKINEKEKMDLVSSIYSYENIKNTEYYNKLNKFIQYTKLYYPDQSDKKDAQNEFRRILSTTVIPKVVYDKNIKEISDCIEIINEKDKSLKEKAIARENLYNYTLSINESEMISLYTNAEILEVGRYEKINVIYSNYNDKYGLRPISKEQQRDELIIW